jgi:hypothetical protein
MSNIYSLKTGLASDTTVWSGGVVPVTGDRVLICAGHVVTLDGSYEWGDDSTATVVINAVSTTASIFIAGTLKFSRSVNTDLRCRGAVKEGGVGAAWDRGTVADPIPAGVTSRVRINYSASAPANNKYNFQFGAATRFALFSEVGAYRKRFSQITSALSAGAISMTLADATGWEIGDWVLLESTTVPISRNNREFRQLTSVAGNTVGWTTGLTYARTNGAYVANLTSNVRWESDSASYYSAVRVSIGPAMGAGIITIKNVSFHGLGGVSDWAGLDLGGGVYYATGSPWGAIDSLAVSNMRVDGSTQSATTGLLSFRASQTPPTVNASAMCFAGTAIADFLWHTSGGTGFFTNGLSIGGSITSNYSQGGVGCRVENTRITGAAGALNPSPAIALTISGGSVDGCDFLLTMNSGSVNLENVAIGTVMGFTDGRPFRTNNAAGITVNASNCTWGAGTLVNVATMKNALSATRLTVRNRDADPTAQEVWVNTGGIFRDNSQLLRSRSSIRFEPIIASTPHGEAYSVTAAAGVPVILRFGLRYDTTYGTATPPTVTVSGLGIEPQTFTAGGVANTDYEQAIVVTPVSTGSLTIAVAGQSTAITGKYWFSGMSFSPFVDWSRHYGYLYAPTSAAQTTNPITQLTEAQAAALTGISYSAGTLTVSSPHTMREVYDWMQWYECSNRLDPILTSADGVSFALAANLVLSASLTGSGSISMPTGTLTNTGTSTVGITSNAGVLTAISVSGLLVGSRVQLFDTTSGTELYNAEPASASLSINVNWAADHTIRLRVGYAVGTDAKLPIEAFGVLSATGASFLVSQVPDAVYNALAINGGLCTEFTPDYPNLQIDVSDGDGSTSVQRLYAWAAWSQTSAPGIASMFRGVSALDSANYVIDTSVVNARLDNVLGTPVIITGGYLSRSDGTSVIAATSGSIQMDPGKAYVASEINTKITKLALLHGLDPGYPLIVTPNTRSAGSVSQAISTVGDTTTVSAA